MHGSRCQLMCTQGVVRLRATWFVGFRERGADGRTVVSTSGTAASSEAAPFVSEAVNVDAPALAPATAPPPNAIDQLIQAVAWPLASLANQTLYVPSAILAPMFGSAWAAMSPVPALELGTTGTDQLSNNPFAG